MFSEVLVLNIFSLPPVVLFFIPLGTSSFSTFLTTLDRTNLFNFGHFNRSVVVSCGFNLHFPND